MNSDQQKGAKNDLEKDFCKLMNKLVFGKKSHVKCLKTKEHYTCNNRKKKNLGIRRRLLYYKNFDRKLFLDLFGTVGTRTE